MAKLPPPIAKALKAAFDAKDWAGLVSTAEAALPATPDSAELLYAIGAGASQCGAHTKALQSFKRLIDLDPNNARGRIGYIDAFGRAEKWGDQAAQIRALRESLDASVASEARRADLSLRLASALYSDGSPDAAIAELRVCLRRLDGLLEPCPTTTDDTLDGSADDEERGSQSKNEGANAAALDPDVASKLDSLRLSAAEALVTAEEARLISSSSSSPPDGFTSATLQHRLVCYGRDAMQAHRLLLVHRLRRAKATTGALSDSDCALLVRHVQLAADRVKAAAGTDIAAAVASEGGGTGAAFTACNSNGDHGYASYRLAAAKLLDIVVWSLRQLGISQQVQSAEIPVSPPGASSAAGSIAALGITWAWLVLPPSTAEWLVALLERYVSSGDAAGSNSSAANTCIARVGRALLTAASSCPPPILTAPSPADAAAASAHAAALSKAVLEATAAVDACFAKAGSSGGAAAVASAVASVPWLSQSLASLYLAVAKTSSDATIRKQSASKAASLISRCISDASNRDALSSASMTATLSFRFISNAFPSKPTVTLYQPGAAAAGAGTGSNDSGASFVSGFASAASTSPLLLSLQLTLGQAYSLGGSHEEAYAAFQAMIGCLKEDTSSNSRGDRQLSAYRHALSASAHSGASAALIDYYQARLRRWMAEPLVSYRVELHPAQLDATEQALDARQQRLALYPSSILLSAVSTHLSKAEEALSEMEEVAGGIVPAAVSSSGSPSLVSVYAHSCVAAASAFVTSLKSRLLNTFKLEGGDDQLSAHALGRQAVTKLAAARQRLAATAAAASSSAAGNTDTIGSVDTLLPLSPLMGCGIAAPALALRLTSPSSSTSLPARPSPVGAFSHLLCCTLDESAAAAAYLALASAAWFAPASSPHEREDRSSGCLPSLLQAAGRDPTCGEAFALMGCWFGSAPGQAPSDATVAADAIASPSALPPRRGLDRARQCWTKAITLSPGHPIATAALVDCYSQHYGGDSGGNGAAAADAPAWRARAIAMLEAASTPTDVTSASSNSAAGTGTSINCAWAWARLGSLALAAGVDGVQAAGEARQRASATTAENNNDAAAAAGAESEALTQSASRSLTVSCTAWQKAIGLTSHALEVEDGSVLAATARTDAPASKPSDDPIDALGLAIKSQQSVSDGDGSSTKHKSSPPSGNDSIIAGLRGLLTRCWHGLSCAYKASGALTAAVKAGEEAVRAHSSVDDVSMASVGTSATKAPLALFPCAPPSVLLHLADCYHTQGAYEDAVAALEAALLRSATNTSTVSDVSGWYALACAHRSLARRCIGDGVLGRGVAHVAQGIGAAIVGVAATGDKAVDASVYVPSSEVMKLSAPALEQRIDVLNAAWQAATAAASTNSSVPFPLWKVLSDLWACCYDAAPLLFGRPAIALAAGVQNGDDDSGRSNGGTDEPGDADSAVDWLSALPGRVFSSSQRGPVIDASALKSLRLGERYASLSPFLPLLTLSADRAVECAARTVDAMTSANAASASKEGDQTAAVSDVILASAWCDVGRLLFLQALAVALAAGSTGSGLTMTSSSPSLALSLALSRASSLRRSAASAHRRALTLCPGLARAWNGLGVTSVHPAEARHALLRSVEAGGGGIALVNYGSWCVAHGALAAAGEALLQAQSKDPNNEAMWLAHALIHEAVTAAAGGSEQAAAVASSSTSSLYGGGLEQLVAAFTLAADLALSPSAVIPSSLHALARLGTNASGTTSSSLSSSSNASVLPLLHPQDIASFALLTRQRDPVNPLALLLAVEAGAARAAEVTRQAYAADSCGSGSSGDDVNGLGGRGGVLDLLLLSSLQMGAQPPAPSSAGAPFTFPPSVSAPPPPEAVARQWGQVAKDAEAFLHAVKWSGGSSGAASSGPAAAAIGEVVAIQAYASHVITAIAPSSNSSGCVQPAQMKERLASAVAALGSLPAHQPMVALLTKLSQY